MNTRLIAQIDAMGSLPVHKAMAYAVQGGKGLRGFFALQSAQLHDVAEEPAVLAGAAIEAIHAYSLIHDDMPCMDDDDLRRGQPTVHRKWDEATAVLAGDALQTVAFELLSLPQIGPNAPQMVNSMARAAGAQGMVLGQALDIAAETASIPLNLNQITALQKGKTGALIQWSATAGPRLAGDNTKALSDYADALGLAFQIADDILDVEGDQATAGKRLQKDAEAGKATFVSLLGLEAAKRESQRLVTEACDALAPYGAKAETLRDAARFVITRDK
ncbi:MAG: polyprenyl synthetase family protein [Pseudomonadota bacterium]